MRLETFVNRSPRSWITLAYLLPAHLRRDQGSRLNIINNSPLPFQTTRRPYDLIDMNYPCVKLFLGENISFPWNSSLKEVWDTDLEAFLYQCRTAISSIEAELEQRRKDVHPKKTMGFKSLSGRLQNCAERIKITHILNNQQAANVKTAVEIMTTNQTTRFEKIYQDVLNDISRLCGPEVVLLCAAALGKHKISHLNQDDRARLLDYLTKKNSTLLVDRLKVLVNNYKVPCMKYFLSSIYL